MRAADRSCRSTSNRTRHRWTRGARSVPSALRRVAVAPRRLLPNGSSSSRCGLTWPFQRPLVSGPAPRWSPQGGTSGARLRAAIGSSHPARRSSCAVLTGGWMPRHGRPLCMRCLPRLSATGVSGGRQASPRRRLARSRARGLGKRRCACPSHPVCGRGGQYPARHVSTTHAPAYTHMYAPCPATYHVPTGLGGASPPVICIASCVTVGRGGGLGVTAGRQVCAAAVGVHEYVVA